ncbi:pyridoxal phosphate-dependent decarboxylase family protein [Hansschlegelia plantiphila]|uniref:L-2,4-diaminobutyrate decarboxylase n=1 Tax=Hansschlegelia plantiphila TaxID=374655 RepID=A0A9W6J0V8_9HYPH|nr:aminotransferase class V-fold PLP-dependent enzyme [Hansschlegelia plantiphila]GLK68745.1 L-2,4-diaminobutyrate decarboxylase [Hansschlegelia plantiphila]
MSDFSLLRAEDRATFTQAFESLAAAIAAGPTGPGPALAGRPEGLFVRATPTPLAEAVEELLSEILPRAARADHPRAFGFVPAPASPISRLGDLLTSAFNPHAGAWPQAAGPLSVERALIRWMASAAGLPVTAGGLFVSGGSSANLTALVAAREDKLPEGRLRDGVAYVSGETHASVQKALRVIGVAADRVRVVATDDRLAMDVGELARAIAADRAAGLIPFVAVATAGSTRAGAVDPLPEIADICARENVWMHVDGAFGASALLSPAHRGLLEGIGRADSLAWDAHKWLFQTYGCGALLVRDEAALRRAFVIGPDYLQDAEPDEGDVNFWDLGPEMTRPARALKLWLTLRTMGADAMGEAVAHGFRLAEWAEDEISGTPGWRVLSPARMAIVTFRFEEDGLDAETLDAVNRAAARRLLEDGFAMVGTTWISGVLGLRICALHPEATERDMRETVRRLDRFARNAAGLSAPR